MTDEKTMGHCLHLLIRIKGDRNDDNLAHTLEACLKGVDEVTAWDSRIRRCDTDEEWENEKTVLKYHVTKEDVGRQTAQLHNMECDMMAVEAERDWLAAALVLGRPPLWDEVEELREKINPQIRQAALMTHNNLFSLIERGLITKKEAIEMKPWMAEKLR